MASLPSECSDNDEDADSLSDELKDVIQHLYEIQSAVHGYLGPETQQELVRQMCICTDVQIL